LILKFAVIAYYALNCSMLSGILYSGKPLARLLICYGELASECQI